MSKQAMHDYMPIEYEDMAFIRGGTFWMGSDDHYPEEAPARRVCVDDFWIDTAPVTNRQFSAFVTATGYVTLAETAPDPALYPGADPAMLRAGSSLFVPPRGPVRLNDPLQWWTFCFRSEEHTSELQSLMRISSAVLCLKNNKLNVII